MVGGTGRNQRRLQLSTYKAMGEEHRPTKPAVPSSQLLHQPATTQASTTDASPHSKAEGRSEKTTPDPARTPPRSADYGSPSIPVGCPLRAAVTAPMTHTRSGRPIRKPAHLNL